MRCNKTSSAGKLNGKRRAIIMKNTNG